MGFKHVANYYIKSKICKANYKTAMNNIYKNKRISFVDISKSGPNIFNEICVYFNSLNYSVTSHLRENNSYVVILSDYPVDKDKLIQILDPYRKFCDTVQLIMVKDKDAEHSQSLNELAWCGITDIKYVKSYNHVLTEIIEGFERWYNFNSFIQNELLKKIYKI
jgi:hypothetical protein